MASTLKTPQVVVVNGDGHVAGRLSSRVAKMLLDGDHVYVVNSEKILISGKRDTVLRAWLKKLEISSVVNPKHGPFHPRTPNGILTRMIRGMIPRRKTKGVEAFRRLRVYVGIPAHYRPMSQTYFDDAKALKHRSYYVSLGQIASALGWKGVSD